MYLELTTYLFQFVATTQPINALAFVFDGVNFGASDFAYSAYSMVISSHDIPFFFYRQHKANMLSSSGAKVFNKEKSL